MDDINTDLHKAKILMCVLWKLKIYERLIQVHLHESYLLDTKVLLFSAKSKVVNEQCLHQSKNDLSNVCYDYLLI